MSDEKKYPPPSGFMAPSAPPTVPPGQNFGQPQQSAYPPTYQQSMGHQVYGAAAAAPYPPAPQQQYAPPQQQPYYPPPQQQQQPYYGQQQQAAYPQQPQTNVTVTVPVAVRDGKYDAGARFTPYSPASVPPPPPGCAPNAQQLMASGVHVQGAAPVVKQKKGGFFTGTGSGGMTFW